MKKDEKSVYDDPKVIKILAMLEQGKSKEEIYTEFGNKNWSSIDMYFRRKGFRWNGKTFVQQEEKGTSAEEEATYLLTKAAQVVRQLSQKYADIRQVALKNGFSNVDELGEYMKSHGYIWKGHLNNYEYDENMIVSSAQTETPESASGLINQKEYKSFIDYLMNKKEKLFELLETENSGTLPRYKFKGAKANKTLGLPTSLQTLLNDFSNEFNVTQRDIIEIALAEFFRNYGYEEQLNSVLQA